MKRINLFVAKVVIVTYIFYTSMKKSAIILLGQIREWRTNVTMFCHGLYYIDLRQEDIDITYKYCMFCLTDVSLCILLLFLSSLSILGLTSSLY